MRLLPIALLSIVALTAACPRDDSKEASAPEPTPAEPTTPAASPATPPAAPASPVVGAWTSSETNEVFDFSNDGQVRVRKVSAEAEDAEPRHGAYTFSGGRFIDFTLGGEGGATYKCELASGAITCTPGEGGAPFKLERGA